MASQFSFQNDIKREISNLSDKLADTQELLLSLHENIEKISQDLRAISVTSKNAKLGDSIRSAQKDLKTRVREHLEKHSKPKGGSWKS